jgi:transposase-like protein
MSKKHVRCTLCGSLSTQRWGVRKTATGKIQRFHCLSCKKSFTCKILTRARVTPAAQVELTRRHLEDRTPIRELVRDTGHSSKTIVKAIHAVTKNVVSAAWISHQFNPVWGGYLAVDGTSVKVWDWSVGKYRFYRRQRRWLHKMSLLVAQDVQTTDIPTHHLDVEEGSIELVTLFQQLKEVGYPLRGLVSDGNEEIPKAARLVFGSEIPHQLCQLHYLKNLRERVPRS